MTRNGKAADIFLTAFRASLLGLVPYFFLIFIIVSVSSLLFFKDPTAGFILLIVGLVLPFFIKALPNPLKAAPTDTSDTDV